MKTKEANEENIKAYLELNKNPVTKAEYDPGLTVAKIPVDAVNSSASGLDPEISQANAWIQAHRVAAVRRLSLATVDWSDLQVHIGPRPRLLRRTGSECAPAEPRPRPPGNAHLG